MEILQLKYFCDAAQSENFSKTAKKYNVPPSNISQSIKRLEAELKTKLFNRKSNSLTLNSDGKVFYTKISRALKLIENAKAEILDTEDKGTLKLCILTNRTIVMKTIEEFTKKYPDIIIMTSYNQADDEEYDIVISASDFEEKSKNREVIISEEFCLAVNRKNPVSKKENIMPEDIKNENFVSMNKESSMYTTMQKICGQMNFSPNVIMQSPDPAFIRKCVELNLGITFFPTISWGGLFSENVAIKKLGGFYRTTYAYKSEFEKKSVTNFINMLKENF